jgi:hypothetical protein
MAAHTQTSDVVKGYTQDLLATIRHATEAVKRHVEEERLDTVPGAKALVQDTVTMFESHLRELESLLESAGGKGPIGQAKEALTTITGVLAGVYGQIRTDTASRALRDDATSLNFIHNATAMLHATALAFKEDRTARVAERILRDIPPMVMRYADVLPHAAVIGVSKDYAVADSDAPNQTVRLMHEAWQAASAHG